MSNNKKENKFEKTKSPCVNICQLNSDDICAGCGRSIKEIINWKEIVQEDRAKEVREKAKERLEEMS